MEKQTFIKEISQPEIAISGKLELDLNQVRADFGDDLNTLFVTNTDTGSDINLYADGKKIAFITSNNGVFSFDWQTGITFNFLSVENLNTAAVISAESVKVFVGRTGRRK